MKNYLESIPDGATSATSIQASAMMCAATVLCLFAAGLIARGLRPLQRRKTDEEGDALRERDLFRTTLRSIGDAVIATDTDGRVTFLNPIAEALTGWSQIEAAGQPLDAVFRIVNETSRKEVPNPAFRALREGVVVGLANHTVLISKDGREWPIDDSAAPIRDLEGAISGAVLVFREISQRKKAEEVVARLAAIVESSDDAIIGKTLDGTIRSWNAGAERIFGYSAAEAIGKSITLIIPSDRLDEERSIIERLSRGERIDHFETLRVAKGGRQVDISLTVSPIHDSEGRVVGASKVARDVTDRKRAEAERARLAETLRLALDSADLGTWEWDPFSDQLLLSQRGAEIFGLEETELRSREWMRGLIAPDYREIAREASARSVAERSDYDIEYPLTNGCWVSARGRGVYDETGKLIRMLGVVQDVTRRKLTEETLRTSETRNRLLVELASATRPLTDHAEIMAVSARILVEHLGAHRCAYAEVENESVYVITGDSVRGAPSIVGRWDLSAFGAEHTRMMKSGEPYVVFDAEHDEKIGVDDRGAYRAAAIGAVICVPLRKNGRLTAAMAVHQMTPRNWTNEEIEIVVTVAGRCWEALERARVERDLRESEARFRTLFEAMDEGYCVIAPILDPLGSPCDYRYVMANPALERHTGFRDVVGKTARQLMPNHEPAWIDAYAEVARTGETIRRTGQVADLGRWYEVAAFPVGGGEVGVLFSDVTARKEAEELLRASEQRLAEVFRHAPSFMGVLRGPDHVFELVNDQYQRLVEGRELNGKPVREALPEVVNQGYIELLDRVYKTGEPYSATGARVVLGHDGTLDERFLDFVYQPLRDTDGAVTGIIVQGVDQTERVRAERALRERDERLHVFLGAATDYAVIIADPQDGIVEWLGGAERITGWTAADAAGRSLGLIFTPEDRAAKLPERELRKALETGRAEDMRWHSRKDGSQFYAEGMTVCLRAPGGEVRGFGKVFRDATLRKRAEDSVRFLADASASLAELVDYESTLGRIANIAVTGFADWCAVDMVEDGKRRRLTVTRSESAEVKAARTEADLTDGVVPHVFRNGEPEVVPDLALIDLATAAQGAERITRLRELGVRSYLSVPLLSRGRLLGGMTFLSHSERRRFGTPELRVAEDLAARVAAAIENAQLYRDLQEQDRRKDEFLATLAHELRNPLAPVRNGLQILKMKRDPAGDEKVVAMMDRQLTHMVHMVDDLLDVSRVSRGKVVLRREQLDLKAVVEAAIETARQAVESGKHELVVSLPEEALILFADRTRLAQIFANLLNNAAKYTPSGGSIRLEAMRESDMAVVRIVDTGLGIPGEMLSKVFDMFTQVGASIDQSQGGLGIGLTLVRRLVELHDGEVSAESAGPGKGSVFTVRLPLDLSEPEREKGVGGRERVSGELLRILVVDDNRDAADSLTLVLEMKGHEVRTAYDGPDAFRVLGTFRPALILLDLGLPGMSGFEVARKIRESSALAGVTLVALTGWGQEDDRRRTRAAGFDYHLVKPADLQEVERIVEAVGSGS